MVLFLMKKKLMYHIEDCKNMYLSIKSANVVLTLTFLVRKNENDIDDMLEEFIVSDYHWSDYDKRSDMHRGVSTITKLNKFDLYLYGAIGNEEQNKKKIGEDLEQNVFYTLQVCWKGNIGFHNL